MLRNGAQRARGGVGAKVGLLLFTDPGIERLPPAHDTTTTLYEAPASSACRIAGSMLGCSTQRAQGRVGARVGPFLFLDPGIERFQAVHDAAALAHAEAGRPLAPVPPDVKGVGREAKILGCVPDIQERFADDSGRVRLSGGRRYRACRQRKSCVRGEEPRASEARGSSAGGLCWKRGEIRGQAADRRTATDLGRRASVRTPGFRRRPTRPARPSTEVSPLRQRGLWYAEIVGEILRSHQCATFRHTYSRIASQRPYPSEQC